MSKHRSQTWDIIINAASIGLNLVGATFIGLGIGYFLDKWLGTHPWMTLFWLLIGIAAGFKNVYLEVRRINAAQDREDARRWSGDARGGRDGSPTPQQEASKGQAQSRDTEGRDAGAPGPGREKRSGSVAADGTEGRLKTLIDASDPESLRRLLDEDEDALKRALGLEDDESLAEAVAMLEDEEFKAALARLGAGRAGKLDDETDDNDADDTDDTDGEASTKGPLQ